MRMAKAKASAPPGNLGVKTRRRLGSTLEQVKLKGDT